MIRSPREAFRDSQHRLAHEKITGTESFQVACEYALLTLLQELPDASNPSAGWDSHSQMVGARRVIDILRTLHQPEKQIEKIKPPTLNYKV